MFKAFVVVVTLSSSSFQMESKKTFETQLECWTHGAVLIKQAAERMPILHASSMCIEIPKENKKEKNGKPSEKTATNTKQKTNNKSRSWLFYS